MLGRPCGRGKENWSMKINNVTPLTSALVFSLLVSCGVTKEISKDIINKEYSIIKFDYSDKYLLTVDKESAEIYKDYKLYSEITIPIGASRVGGPVVDLPDSIKYPEGYFFMAQLDMTEISQYDENGFLPKTGFLYFFVRHYGEDGKVFYTSEDKSKLKRVIKEHDDWYFFGRLVKNLNKTKETIKQRYEKIDGEVKWDYFSGEDISKLYGIYTNCQANEKDIINKMRNQKELLLLQIGSNFFGEGAHEVFIDAADLLKHDFSKCIFEYNQS
jgi:hypothetical protein